MFWFFGHKACGILAPQPGIEPTPLAREGKVLTTGPLGKSQFSLSISFFLMISISLPFCAVFKIISFKIISTNLSSSSLILTVSSKLFSLNLNCS